MQVKQFVTGSIEENCYIIIDESVQEAAVIDPGDNGGLLVKWLSDNKLAVKYVINTHGHADHIGADDEIRDAFGAKLVIHEKDAAMLGDAKMNLSAFMGANICIRPADIIVHDGDNITVGGLNMQILHTPGHTPGGICILMDTALFSGDTLFAGSVGRCDFPGGSMQDLMSSLQSKLIGLDDDLTIYPGHGDLSTIADEKRHNPYLTQIY